MRLVVLGTARRALSAMSLAQATHEDTPRVLIAEIDRSLADMGVAVAQHNLRYVAVRRALNAAIRELAGTASRARGGRPRRCGARAG